MTCKALAIALFGLIICASLTAPLCAQEKQAGSQLVYDVKLGGQGGMGGGRTMSMTFTIAIGSVNSDGSATAKASISGPGMPSGFGFDTTISSTGAILPKYDPSVKAHSGMSMAEAQKVTENAAAQGFSMNFRSINAFADACGKREALHVGDSWTGEMDVPFAVAAAFTVTGRQTQSGRTLYNVSVKNAPGAATLSAQGTYDPTEHLVTAFHSSVSNQKGESETTDVTLRP